MNEFNPVTYSGRPIAAMGLTTSPILRTASSSLPSAGVASNVFGALVVLVLAVALGAPGKSTADASGSQTVPAAGRVPFWKYARSAPCVQSEGATRDMC